MTVSDPPARPPGRPGKPYEPNQSPGPDVEDLLEAARAAGESAAGWWLELANSAAAAVTSQALDLLTTQSLSKIRDALGADEASFLIANGDELVARAAVGLNQEISVDLRIKRGEGMAGRVLEAREPLVIGDLSKWQLASPTLHESGMASVVAVPIIDGERALGVLHAGSRQKERFGPGDAELLMLAAERLAPAIARVGLLQAERRARQGAEGRVRQLAQLQEVTQALGDVSTSTGLAEVLHQIVVDLAPDSGRWVSVWLRQSDRLVLAAGNVALQEEELGDGPVEVRLDEPYLICEAARTRRPVFAATAGELLTQLPTLTRLGRGEQSVALVPIVLGGETVAVLRVTSPAQNAFGNREVETLQLIAHQAGQALDRARLYERREDVARLSGFLANASRITAEAPDLVSALNRLADLALQAIGDICLVDILGEDGDIDRLVVRHRDPARQQAADRLRVEFPPQSWGPHPVGEVLKSGSAKWSGTMSDQYLRDTTRSEEHYRLTKSLEFRSYLAVPLSSRGVVGVVTFVSSSREFDQEDVRFAQELAAQVGAVIGNAHRYEATLRTSHILQRALLPPRLPEVPGVKIESRYMAATGSTEVGGDFYDVIMPTSDQADFLIGDVAGHGREAAAMMGQLRSACRALGLKASGPAEVVALLQEGWDRMGFGRMATALLMRYVPSARRITAVSAGHYPPLMLGDGQPRYLPVPPNPPFGAPTGPSIREWTGSMRPGRGLLLYTDGIIDDQHRGIDASMEMLARSAADGPTDPASVCDRVISIVGNDRNDDVALLAIKFD